MGGGGLALQAYGCQLQLERSARLGSAKGPLDVRHAVLLRVPARAIRRGTTTVEKETDKLNASLHNTFAWNS